MNELQILNQPIRILDGLYALNDFHKASGGADKHRPTRFIRNGQAQKLIREIGEGQKRPPIQSVPRGKNQGTWVCKELVYAYAMWISPAFSLKVIRAFDELTTKPASLPTTYKEALQHLLVAVEQNEQLALENKEMQPKAEFYDAVTESDTTCDLGTVAKTLNLGIGRNALFKILRDNKILMGNNLPYQYHIDLGRFRVVESKFTAANGETQVCFKTVATQKGVDFVRKTILTSLNPFQLC